MTEASVKYWTRYSRVTAYGLGITNPTDLEDVAQNCILNCLKAWDRMTGNREAYLGRVVRNCCITWLDREAYRSHERLEPLWNDEDRQDDNDFIDESALTENDIVSYLSAENYLALSHEQDAQLMRLVSEGYAEREIASKLGIRCKDVRDAVSDIQKDANRVYEHKRSCKNDLANSLNT